MQPNKNINDLEYLANLGFQESGLTDSDISKHVNQINKNFKKQLTLSNTTMRVIINFLVLTFFGISVYFLVANKTVVTPTVSALSATNMMLDKLPEATKVIALDTLEVSDNFIKKSIAIQLDPEGIASKDTLEFQTLTSNQITQITDEQSNTNQLKFISNSTIHYIHDLKVTNYTQLYFKDLEKIEVNENLALELQYPLKYKSNPKSGLKDYSPLFLNEVLSLAMLDFKNQKFKECKFKLSLLQKFNAKDDNVLFYNAMCFYYQGFYADALNGFELALQSKNNCFYMEAEYYKAMCLLQTNEKENAKSMLQKIEREEGFYASKAKAQLEEWIK